MTGVREAVVSGAAALDGHAGYAGWSPADLATRVVIDAVRNAGLEAAAIDAVYAGDPLVERHSDFSAVVAQQLGIQPRAGGTVARGGATGVSLLAIATQAIAAGHIDHAVCVWADNRRSAARGAAVQTLAGEIAWHERACGPLPATQYALITHLYMQRFGATPEQFAAVPVVFRSHAALNPAARHRDPINIADVLDSPMVSSPIHRLECALVTDFAGAVVVSRDGGAPGPSVRISGVGQSTTHDNLTAGGDLIEQLVTGAAHTGQTAFRQAGTSAADVDLAMLYDCFPIAVALQLEMFGFCGRGEALELVDAGTLSRGGPLPCNTHGGMMSCATSGMLHVVEAVLQLRGEAGAHQLERRPARALVHGNGGVFSTHATVILEA